MGIIFSAWFLKEKRRPKALFLVEISLNSKPNNKYTHVHFLRVLFKFIYIFKSQNQFVVRNPCSFTDLRKKMSTINSTK